MQQVIGPRAGVARRRRMLFVIGASTMALTVAVGLAFGTGCIFADGNGYHGGGRRTGAPTSSDDQSPLPNPTSSSTGSSDAASTGSSTSTSPPPDSGNPGDTGSG
jgi:hypothetical protein